jgi:type IV pilus assembly protein PilM
MPAHKETPLIFKSFFKNTLIGLDIQLREIRLIQLGRGRQSLQISHQAEKILPCEIGEDGVIRDWEALLVELSAWVRERGVIGSKTAIALPLQQVKRQTLRLPEHLQDEEIEAEVRDCLERETYIAAESYAVDFARLAVEDGMLVVAFAAVARAYLDRYVQCVEAAGLRVKVVDIDTDAVARAEATLSRCDQVFRESVDISYYRALGLALREVPLW